MPPHHHHHQPQRKRVSTMVKGGKPVLQIPYRYLRLIGTVVIIYHLCILAYMFEMINIAIHIKGHIGDYLNMIFENGYEMVYVLASTAILGILINIFIVVIVFKIFSNNGKVFYYILFVAVVVCIVLMLTIFGLIIYMMVYANRMNPESMDTLYKSMNNYSTDGLTKTRIDVMQIELQCCGCRNYSDWYDLEWYDKNFIQMAPDNIKVSGEAPFSCCNIRTVFPCVHHGIETGPGDYKYTIDTNFSLNVNGCWNAMEERKTTTGWMVAGYLFCQLTLTIIGFIPLRFIQTASNERQGFDQESYVYTAWLWGCYVGRKDMKTETTDMHASQFQ